MTIFGRLYLDEFMPKQNQDSLHEITLFKEKICKKGGRACSDGRSQIAYIRKEEAAAPTVPMEALMSQLMIDMFEER